MSLSSGTKLGPYEVLSQLGAGGMGVVYRCKDSRLGRDVAVKVLPESFAQDADRLRRFQQEARVISALNHPNILAIFDVGELNGTPYLVSELLEGSTLRDKLQAGALPQRRAIEFAVQIARGLAAAHEKGIVHRDLKPENIFITEDGRIKILDFGLAKNTRPEAFVASASLATLDGPQESPTAAGQVLGTVGYMSPEQVRGQAADHRSDIFAFGAILYEMLSGKRAFKKDSGVETMSAILNEEPPELTETNRNIAPGLERIVRHCLEKSPTQRFQSASDVAFQLESLSDQTGTSTRLQSIRSKEQRKWIQYAFIAALIAVAAIGGYLLGRSRTNPNLASLQQLTFQRGTLNSAAFAPDGQTVIYSARWNGAIRDTVYTTRIDALQGRPLGIEDAYVLGISTKGELALLLHPRGSNDFQGTLGVVAVAGGSPRELMENVRDVGYTPDGSAMAVSRFVNGESRLEYPVGKVLHSRKVGYISDVRISPDGDLIAFADHTLQGDNRGKICVTDKNGKVTELTPEYATVSGIAWAKGGKEIWYSASDSGSAGSLFAVTLSGKARMVYRSPGMPTLFAINNNGELLLGNSSYMRETFAKGPSTNKEVNISVFDFTLPRDISADGKLVLVDEEGEGGGPNYATFLVRTDGSGATRIGEGTGNDLSPDGKWVAAVSPKSPSPLWLYPTGAGETKTFTNNGINHTGVFFFGDGKRLVLLGNEPNKGQRTWVMNLDGSGLKPVSAEGDVAVTSVFPDGHSIIVAGGDGIPKMLDIETGATKAIPTNPELASLRFIGFTADGKGTFAGRDDGNKVTVARVDNATMKVTPHFQTAPADMTGGSALGPIVITPDGKYYAYSFRRVIGQLYLAKGLN